jgi:hypothetical protein
MKRKWKVEMREGEVFFVETQTSSPNQRVIAAEVRQAVEAKGYSWRKVTDWEMEIEEKKL